MKKESIGWGDPLNQQKGIFLLRKRKFLNEGKRFWEKKKKFLGGGGKFAWDRVVILPGAEEEKTGLTYDNGDGWNYRGGKKVGGGGGNKKSCSMERTFS